MTIWRLGDGWEDEAVLARAWESAAPFPHLVFDDFVPMAAHDELLSVIDDEVVDHFEADFYAFDATLPEPKTEAFRALREAFARTLSGPLSRISKKLVSCVDMRAYAYRPGHFLLPHSDHQLGIGRTLAYAYYLPTPEPPLGGELELFRCAFADGEMTDAQSAVLIEPRSNRLVVFEVSDASLHQVREVTAGLRASLSGWFYP